ncbi:neuronal acetylcholine receptor subunit alpha-7-like [Mytilus californianus]|uniref:neuronal acetylcholine receptor subunit alpha-7-like n=1 Tax=Mytilus californianus TaxID=6549 RepID=UPI0022454892|nr:neuronal acetylcholine receptor subunit alpha-7-like [Mytilus californianus]
MNRFIFCLMVLHQLPLPSFGQTLENVTKLYDDLFSSYRRNIIPMNNHSEPIEISLAFYLLSINSFREIEETLVLTGGLSVIWKDASLSWNPEDYGNTYSLEVDSTDIWIPWIYLINNAKEFEPVGFDSAFRVYINSSGFVQYSPGSILEAKCQTDISTFPLDTQPCLLEFLTWSGHAGTYKLISSFNEVNLDYYTKNSNWEVITGDTYAQLDPRGYYRFFMSLSLKREPVYYIVMIVLPTMLLSLLNPLVFLLPVESGERISLAMTVLLSYAIFLTLVSASIPASSNPMCFLLIVMIIIMLISGLTVVAVIITTKVYYQEEYFPGRIVKFFLYKKTRNQDVTPIGCEKKENQLLNGKNVSNFLDKLFLFSSYVIIVIILVAFFLYVNV